MKEQRPTVAPSLACSRQYSAATESTGSEES